MCLFSFGSHHQNSRTGFFLAYFEWIGITIGRSSFVNVYPLGILLFNRI